MLLEINVDQFDLLVSLRYIKGVPLLQNTLFIVALIIIILIGVLYWFFGTELGAAIRATGCNAAMARAQGINTGLNRVIGLMLSNALVALSGALLAQYQGFADFLDEHTAALDPKTAAKVLETTDEIIKRNNLTTLMITHNMKDAIAHGNRLIMMMDGNIILDIKGEEKKKLTVEDLLHKFEEASGEEFASDKALLG